MVRQSADTALRMYDCVQNLDWVLINWWNLYRSTQDATLLPDLYAVLRGEVNKQVHLAIKNETDGTLFNLAVSDRNCH